MRLRTRPNRLAVRAAQWAALLLLLLPGACGPLMPGPAGQRSAADCNPVSGNCGGSGGGH